MTKIIQEITQRLTKKKAKISLALSLGLATLVTTTVVTNRIIYVASGQAFEENPEKLIDEVWKLVNRRYVDGSFNDLDWKEVRTGYLNHTYTSRESAYEAIHEMLEQLEDPYTRFMAPQAFENWKLDRSSEFTGVGIQIYHQEARDQLIIVSPFADSPAEKAGILSGDIIAAIDRQTTDGMTLDEAVALIRGPVHSSVQLTIRRAHRLLTFDLSRASVSQNSVSYSIEKAPRGPVGYIRLTQFSTNASTEIHQAIQALEAKSVHGYVLDLRDNPGGNLSSCIEIARMWINQGKIVSTVNRKQTLETAKASEQAITDKPLVVLVDQGSASASELLSGALQDHNRATVVGTQTFGKGLVQIIMSLPGGYGLAISRAKYLTPSGRDVNKVGITPDIQVILTDVQRDALILNSWKPGTVEDPQYTKAISVLMTEIDES